MKRLAVLFALALALAACTSSPGAAPPTTTKPTPANRSPLLVPSGSGSAPTSTTVPTRPLLAKRFLLIVAPYNRAVDA